MDNNLIKSTAFHPQIDGQTKVVNQMIIQILRMYHPKHPHTWDESLPYVQHIYNMEIHSSTNHNPFEVCLGYQPLALINVSIPVMKLNMAPYLDKEKNKAIKFIDKIHHLQ